MNKKTLIPCIILLVSLTMLAQPTQFRGEERNGVYSETDLLDSWPDEGPELLAAIEGIGDGFGSPSINEKGIFIAGMIDSIGYIFHFNHQHQLQWKVPYGNEYTFKYTGTRGTPTLDGNRLFYSGTFGDAVCLDVNNGDYIWKKNIFELYNGRDIKWGYAESPLVYENIVILTPGGDGYNIVGLDKTNGELVWNIDLDSTKNAHDSPTLVNHNGQDLALMKTTGYLLLFHPKTGKIAYKHTIAHPRNVHPVSAIYRNGKILNTTGYREGAVLYNINESTRGLDTIYYTPDLDCRISGLIEVDGTVFGASYRKKQWVGVDLSTGKTLFNSRELKPGSFLLADGKFYIFTETGEVGLAIPNRDGFSVISSFPIPVTSVQYGFAHPVIYEGILYIRYREHLWLYKVGQS